MIQLQDHLYDDDLIGKDGTARVESSVAVLAEITLRSPQKIFILIIKKYIYRIKVKKNK